MKPFAELWCVAGAAVASSRACGADGKAAMPLTPTPDEPIAALSAITLTTRVGRRCWRRGCWTMANLS